MTIYLLLFVVPVLVLVALGISYVAKKSSDKRRVGPLHPTDARKYEPVTLDRSPEMPHRQDATS